MQNCEIISIIVKKNQYAQHYNHTIIQEFFSIFFHVSMGRVTIDWLLYNKKESDIWIINYICRCKLPLNPGMAIYKA